MLIATEAGFQRRDYSLDEWTGPPAEAYCHFRTRVPVRTQRKRVFVDNEVLVAFFRRLAEETEPARLQFRFVLALILMRKRLLRYDGSERTEAGEFWQMTLTADQSRHRVLNPELSDDEVGQVSAQLSAILHGDMGEFSDDLPDADDPREAGEGDVREVAADEPADAPLDKPAGDPT